MTLNRQNSLAIFGAIMITGAILTAVNKLQEPKPPSAESLQEAAKILATPVQANTKPSIPAATPELSPSELREELATEYLGLIVSEFPHLNFIKQKVVKAKGGYALWAVHEYFTENSFAIGEPARAISNWIDTHRADLKRAGINRVGLQSANEYLGSCFYNLK